jgi:hypothetical protein
MPVLWHGPLALFVAVVMSLVAAHGHVDRNKQTRVNIALSELRLLGNCAILPTIA